MFNKKHKKIMAKEENVRQLTREEVGSIDRLKCKETDFSELKGKTLTAIYGLEEDSEFVAFYASDGSVYKMKHTKDCCESVAIDDVCGDVEDLIGSEIVVAEVNSNSKEDGAEPRDKGDDSYTWTFYKLATKKGYVDIRWYGESNGYYSEEVEFYKLDIDINKEREKQVNVANKQAGYDIPLAFAALNAITIQGQMAEEIPLFESQCDLGAAVDVVMRANGGTLNDNGLAMLLNLAVAYGWHYAKEGESLLRSGDVEAKILGFVDKNDKILITEKNQRKTAIIKGYEALSGAIERATARLKMQRTVRK